MIHNRGPATSMTVWVYDTSRDAWRKFTAEPGYSPRCGYGLHQFLSMDKACAGACACGTIRAEDGVPPPHTKI